MVYRRDKYDYSAIRDNTLKSIAESEIETFHGLPLLDDSLSLRPANEIIGRSLALVCVVVRAFGFGSSNKILEWLQTENIELYLTSDEKEFLFQGNPRFISDYKTREECLWAFVWSLGFQENLDFTDYCEPSLSSFFPRFMEGEGSTGFREKCKLRSEIDIITHLDLAYCLHWAVNEAELKGRPSPLKISSYVIAQRRRTLEWVLSQEDWNSISLDT